MFENSFGPVLAQFQTLFPTVGEKGGPGTLGANLEKRSRSWDLL